MVNKLPLLFIPPSLGVIISLVLGIFVLSRNYRSPINRSFSYLCFGTAYWQICWLISYFLANHAQKILICKIAYMLAALIPFFYYHYAVQFIRLTSEMKWVKVGYGVTGLFLILLWATDLFIEGYQNFSWGIYPRVGLLHPIYLFVVFISMIRALILLKHAVNLPQISSEDRNRNRLVFYTHLIYSLAAIEYPITYGFIQI